MTRSSSKTDVHVLIARADFLAPSGDGTRGLGIAALGGLEGAFHFSRGGGERTSRHVLYKLLPVGLVWRIRRGCSVSSLRHA